MPSICQAYFWYISGIYQVYTKNIPCIFQYYAMNTQNVLLWSSCLSRGHQSETRFVAGRGLFIAKAIINSLWPLQSPSYNLYFRWIRHPTIIVTRLLRLFHVLKLKLRSLPKPWAATWSALLAPLRRIKRKGRGNQALSLMTVTR